MKTIFDNIHFVVVNIGDKIKYNKNKIDEINEKLTGNLYINFIKTKNFFYENEYTDEEEHRQIIEICQKNDIPINGICIGLDPGYFGQVFSCISAISSEEMKESSMTFCEEDGIRILVFDCE